MQSTIQAAQIQQPTKFIPFVQEEKLKGLYPSFIHLNFHGGNSKSKTEFNDVGPEMTLLRREIGFYDNNMFVTAWVSQIMLELTKLGVIEFPETPLMESLQTLLSFKDKNHPEDTPIYCFWKQIEKNLTSNETVWIEWPTNIADPLSESVL